MVDPSLWGFIFGVLGGGFAILMDQRESLRVYIRETNERAQEGFIFGTYVCSPKLILPSLVIFFKKKKPGPRKEFTDRYQR